MPVIAVTIVDQTVAVTQVGEIGPTGATGATGTVSAAGDGTAGAPGIAFASDTNTGLFRPGADILAASTGGTERARINAAGNFCVGGTNPLSRAVFSAAAAATSMTPGSPTGVGLSVANTDTTYGLHIGAAPSGDSWIQAARLDGIGTTYNLSLQAAGGYVGVGTTGATAPLHVSDGTINTTAGVPTLIVTAANRALTSEASIFSVQSTSAQAIDTGGSINLGGRGTDASSQPVSYGHIAGRKENGTSGNFAGYLHFGTSDAGSDLSERLRISSAGHTTPGADNTQNFGSGSLRWATIFAGTGTINTSDERYKVLREGGDLSDAEHRAWSAVRAIVYRDKDSFERKGDAARLHIGYSWQSIQAAFEAEGLDPARYGLWCEDALEAPVEKTRTATRPVEGQTETVPVLDDDGQPVFEQVQETEEVEQPFEEVRMIDGAPVLVKGVRTVAQPVFDSVQIRDEDGELVFTDPDPETGNPVPRMAPVPRMISRPKTETVPVMEEVEETYTEMEPTGETRGALRYSQCSVIEAAWLRRELASLTARVSALEAV
jgi:hypothetical protein